MRQDTQLKGQRRWLPYACAFAGSWALLVGIYLAAGDFHAEFSGADEAAHVVSSIMVREYLAGPLWNGVSPMTFAQEYYARYPKVAIGHWPPVYFVAQGMWLLLTGASRQAVLVWSAAQSALFAVLTMWLCRREGLRWSMAVTAGVVTVLLPVHLYSLREIGSDVMAAIAIIIATLCCQRWVAQPDTRNGTLLALSSALALLIKGSAFVLVLVVPLTLLLVRRNVSWLWSRETWRVFAIVAVLALPWYFFSRAWLAHEILPSPSHHFGAAIPYSIKHNGVIFLTLGGVAMLPLALLSLRRSWIGRAPAIAVLPVATWLFLTFVSPHTDARLFLPVVPVLVFGAAMAASTLIPRAQEFVLIASLAVSYLTAHITPSAAMGFIPAVEWMTRAPHHVADRILVTSNGLGEGALISEFALHEPSPQRTIVRATKVLQSSGWMGYDVQLRVHSAADVARILEQHAITLVVRHTSIGAPSALYEHSLDQALSQWRLAPEFGEIRIYSRPANDSALRTGTK